MAISMAGWGKTGRGHYLSINDSGELITVAVIKKDFHGWKLAVKEFKNSTIADAWLDSYQADKYVADWTPPQYTMIFDRLTDARDIGHEKLAA